MNCSTADGFSREVFTGKVYNYLKEIKIKNHHRHRKKKFCFLCKSHANNLTVILGAYVLLFSSALIILVLSLFRIQNLNETELNYYVGEYTDINNDDGKILKANYSNSAFLKKLYKAFQWPFKSSEFNCSHLSSIKTFNFVTSGWTKNVFSFEHMGKKYALKAVNVNGTDIKNCLEKYRMNICYEKAKLKMYKEYILSKELPHRSIIEVLAWCVSSSDFLNEVAIITELCSPIDMITLLRMPFEQRLKIMLDLSALMVYLENSPLGSIAINDFQRQQFVLCGNTVKLTDLDDLSVKEPKCNSASECNKDPLEISQKIGSAQIKCINNFCLGYNTKQNVINTFKHFVNLFLNITTPYGLEKYVDELFDVYKNTWNAKVIFKATQDLYLRYIMLYNESMTHLIK